MYRVEQEDLSGPWEVTNVLQPTIYENDKGAHRVFVGVSGAMVKCSPVVALGCCVGDGLRHAQCADRA